METALSMPAPIPGPRLLLQLSCVSCYSLHLAPPTERSGRSCLPVKPPSSITALSFELPKLTVQIRLSTSGKTSLWPHTPSSSQYLPYLEPRALFQPSLSLQILPIHLRSSYACVWEKRRATGHQIASCRCRSGTPCSSSIVGDEVQYCSERYLI